MEHEHANCNAYVSIKIKIVEKAHRCEQELQRGQVSVCWLLHQRNRCTAALDVKLMWWSAYKSGTMMRTLECPCKCP